MRTIDTVPATLTVTGRVVPNCPLPDWVVEGGGVLDRPCPPGGVLARVRLLLDGWGLEVVVCEGEGTKRHAPMDEDAWSEV